MMRYQKFGVAAVVVAAALLSTGPVAAQLSQCAVQIGPLFAGLDRRSAKAGIANLRVRGTVQQQRLQRGRGVCDEGRQITHSFDSTRRRRTLVRPTW
jgi:hypothetical protein